MSELVINTGMTSLCSRLIFQQKSTEYCKFDAVFEEVLSAKCTTQQKATSSRYENICWSLNIKRHRKTGQSSVPSIQ